MLKINGEEYRADNNYKFGRIHEISHMSIDSFGNFDFRNKNISKLNDKLIGIKQNLDISSGFDESYVPSNAECDEDYILHCVLDLQLNNKQIPMKFLSYRGTLTKVASFPYENKDNITLSIIKYKGVIFIWNYRSNLEQQTESVFHHKAIYSGFRFEKLVTNYNNNYASNLPEHKYLSMVCSKLKSKTACHYLIYAGEIDCERESDGRYIELKSRFGKSSNINYTLKRYNFLKWWLQSYLIGIKNVVVGYRDENFIVKEVVDYDINFFCDSARNVRSKSYLWNPEECFAFLGTFLSKIENYVENFNDMDILLVNFDVKERSVTFTTTNQQENPKFDFLPIWFREKFVNPKTD